MAHDSASETRTLNVTDRMDTPCKHKLLPNNWRCRISGTSRHSHAHRCRMGRFAGISCGRPAVVRRQGQDSGGIVQARCPSRRRARDARQRKTETRKDAPAPTWRYFGKRTVQGGHARASSAEWHLLMRALMNARSHHEELAAVPTALPALSTLVPFVIALWLRVKNSHVGGKSPRKGDV